MYVCLESGEVIGHIAGIPSDRDYVTLLVRPPQLGLEDFIGGAEMIETVTLLIREWRLDPRKYSKARGYYGSRSMRMVAESREQMKDIVGFVPK